MGGRWIGSVRPVSDDAISLSEAARISGVSASTLKRWASERVIPVRRDQLDPRGRGPGPGGGADARARALAGGPAPGRSRRPARLRLHRGPAARQRALPHSRRGCGDLGSGGGADRADHVAAGDADGAGGNAHRGGRGGDGDDRRGPAIRLPARRRAAADPRLRPVDPQDRRGRGPPLPPVRPRAADPPGRRLAGDGRGDGGPRPRAAAAHLAAHGVRPPALPALLPGAGRRRPHGGRDGAGDDGPGADGLLLRRPHRLHPLHGGGGRRGGARPGRALRRDASRRRCRRRP